jgi:hypothetical protein
VSDATADALRRKVEELAKECPGITFGYIGNCGVDRSGPFDDRSWYVFLPVNGRISSAIDHVGGFSTDYLPEMLANWDKIAQNVRILMKGTK